LNMSLFHMKITEVSKSWPSGDTLYSVVCIRFGVRNSLCKLRSPKSELSVNRPLSLLLCLSSSLNP